MFFQSDVEPSYFLKHHPPAKNLSILMISISMSNNYNNAGIDLVTGYLREEGYSVDVCYYHKNESYDHIRNHISYGYDIYGFTVFPTNIKIIQKLSGDIKENNEQATIILGGTYATLFHEDLFNDDPHIDYICLGDGEEPMSDFLASYERYGLNIPECALPVSIVPRISTQNKRPNVRSEDYYHQITDYYDNDSLEANLLKTHCILTKNNICLGACSFCTSRKGKVVFRDVDDIIAEIEWIHGQFGVTKFYFVDDNLFDPKTLLAKIRIERLCEKIINLPYNLQLEGLIKADVVTNEKSDTRLLELMNEAGFTSLFVGIESFNHHDLILYNKKTTVAQNISTVSLLHKNRIYPKMGFIMYNPYSTVERLRKNYETLLWLKATNLHHYTLSILQIYKYTKIYRRVKQDRLLKPGYSIYSNMEYYYIDRQVKEIVDFLSYEFYYDYDMIHLFKLQEYFYFAVRKDPRLIALECELNALIDNHMDLYQWFFDAVFVHVDIEKAKSMLPAFNDRLDSFQSDLYKLKQRISEKRI